MSEHARRQKISFGINHEMHDFTTGRKKNLDLVICTPKTRQRSDISLAEYGSRNGIVMLPEEKRLFDQIPLIESAEVGAVLVAVEAKAVMTAHLKALPRLHDELVSSHAVIHGSSDEAIAVGLAYVNAASKFFSTDMNKRDLSIHPPMCTDVRQPSSVIRTIAKLQEIPRRTVKGVPGFDAFGIVLVDFDNRGSSVRLVDSTAFDLKNLDYTAMVSRITALYTSRFGEL